MADGGSSRLASGHELYEDLRDSLREIYNLSKKVVKRLKAGNFGKWLYRKLSKKAPTALSHWHQLFEGFQESPQRIFTMIEEAINQRKIPGIKVSRIDYPEAGVLSAKREYLRVSRNEYVFDICAAPFGTGFFFSWWLGKKGRLSWIGASLFILLLPIIGLIIVILVGVSLRQTYYRLDTAMMFQDSVHTAVLEVIDQVTEGKGLRGLTESEKKPIMSDLFKRKLA